MFDEDDAAIEALRFLSYGSAAHNPFTLSLNVNTLLIISSSKAPGTPLAD
jgi:hypothetical protein